MGLGDIQELEKSDFIPPPVTVSSVRHSPSNWRKNSEAAAAAICLPPVRGCRYLSKAGAGRSGATRPALPECSPRCRLSATDGDTTPTLQQLAGRLHSQESPPKPQPGVKSRPGLYSRRRSENVNNARSGVRCSGVGHLRRSSVEEVKTVDSLLELW